MPMQHNPPVSDTDMHSRAPGQNIPPGEVCCNSVREPCISPPIQDAINAYLAQKSPHGGRRGYRWTDSHVQHVTQHLGWWVQALNVRTVADISDGRLADIEDALSGLASTPMDNGRMRSTRTLLEYQVVLGAFCRWLERRRWIQSNPTRLLDSPKARTETPRRAITIQEFGRLMRLVPEPRSSVYLLAMASGLRASEIGALRAVDLDADHDRIRLRPEHTKNREGGWQLIPHWVSQALWRASSDMRDLDPLLQIPSRRAIRKDFQSVGIEANTDDGTASFHSFRHGYGTLLQELAIPLADISRLMRHRSCSVTERYLHPQPYTLRAVVERLGEALRVAIEPRTRCSPHTAPATDPSLTEVIHTWSTLTPAIRGAITAIVQEAGGGPCS